MMKLINNRYIHQIAMRTTSPQITTFTALLLLALLTTLTKCQSAPIQTLTLGLPFNTTQAANTYAYYQLTFNVTNNMLEITIDQDSKSLVGIYLSIHPTNSNEVYYSYPNETSNTQECYQSSLDTCIIRLDKYQQLSEITVYFSVYTFSESTYDLLVAQDDFYNVNVQSRYMVSFSEFSSGVLKLSGDQLIGMEEIVMILTYNTSGVVGKFKVKAAVDQVPNGYTSLNGVSVGAFNKIIKLQPIQNTSCYYILIEGEKGSKFSLQFDESSLSAPSIAVNSSIIYYTRQNISYHTITGFENVALPLFIRLDAYLGYGVFSIDYCGGLMQTTFQNINGQNGEIAITPFERMNCKTKVISTSFGLLAENLEISIVNVNYEFGYKIGIYEGNYTTLVHLNEQIFGLFLYFEQSRLYPLQIPSEQTNPLYLMYNQLTEANGTVLTFQVEECQKRKLRDKCKSIASSNNSANGELVFTPKSNMTYDVKITYPSSSNSTITLEYVLEMYSETKEITTLIPSKLYLQEIEENQYKFYQINLTQVHEQQGIIIKNLSELTIHIKQLNGEVTMLTSLTIPQPTFDKGKQESSDIIYNWSGSTMYLVNETTDIIYIGVRGYEQSLFYIHYTINVDADIPAKYTKIVDGTQNNFILNTKTPYQLITFSSHIIPYKISITGSPLCIRFGHTLPLNQSCVSTLPSQFTDKVVYLNISNGDVSSSSFKFSVYINSGNYELDEKDPLLIGCIDSCYQIVTIFLKESSNVIHQGRGNIYDLSNPNQGATNNYLNLSCSSYPCIAKINASLPYGGQMTLFLETSDIQVIGWMGRPITFGSYPKRFIFEIKSWSSVNSILIYSEAMQLNVYYNVIDIHEGKTNVLTYNFPTETQYQVSSSGNPLRTIHTIIIDDTLLQQKKCKKSGSFCLVTLSLYPNLNIEYNENYRKQGVGFISSNIYEYFSALNTPLRFSGKFSMSYFTHHYESKLQKLAYRVNIEPLSNCHPKLFTGENFKNPNFEDPSYDDGNIIARNQWMNYSVLVEKPCNYVVTLTNTPFQSVIQNKYYYLQLSNGEITVIYRSQYSSALGFTIQVDSGSLFTKVDYILVNKLDGNSISIPTIKNNNFMAVNKSTLTVQQASDAYYSLYAITIVSKAQSIKLLVRKSGPIILTHNQEHIQTIGSNSIMSYRIYSTGSIALFITTNSQRPVVTINKHYNSTNVFTTYLTDRSSPWIYINASSSDLETYDITVNNNAASPISIHLMFEQNDSLAFRKIYEGIIAYDAFVSKQEMNCYTYETPMLLGRKDLMIDFVLGKNQVIDSTNCEITNSCFKLQYKAMAKDTIVKSSIELLKSNSTAYRIKVQFVPRQNYTFCFHTPNTSVLNIEYYILLNDPQMEHILEDYTLTQNYESVYDMYEIVEEGFNENILIEVTSCSPSQKNERVIVGSSNFVDSENGRFTDLQEYYKNSDSIFAKLSVQEGYYYLGVKNNIYMNEFFNIYTIRFQNLGKSQTLLANKWHLRETKIVKIYINAKTESISIEVPEVISSSSDLSQGNITITYTIHILDMNNGNDVSRIPLSILARCPNYHQSKLNEGSNAKKDTNSSVSIIKKSLTFYYDDLQTYQQRKNVPMFDISRSDIPLRFNITGRIDVSVDSQMFSYYYDTTYKSMDLTEGQSVTSALAFLSIMAIFTAIVVIVVGVIVCYRMHKKNVEKKKVAFQMANFNETGDNPTARRQQREALTTPAGSRVKGYGDLVDQIG